jgi:uncharacterized protein Yka (UPF0111/DUF47 family)
MKNILKFLMPNEDKFFLLLNQQADNLLETGKIFCDSIEKYNNLSAEEKRERQKKIKDREEAGDVLSYHIIEQIDTNLITPFDREDVHELTILIDDILDSIDSTFRRIIYCDLKKTDEIMINLNNSIMDSIEAIHCGIGDLKTLKEIKSYCTKIETIENQSDTFLAMGLLHLFQNVKDPILLFKTKEIYEHLESITDRCKVVSRVLRSVTVKHG